MITALPALVLLVAQATVTPQDQIESLAQSIQKGDARAALDLFDGNQPGFTEVKRNIEGLSRLPDTTCTISILHTSQTGDTIQFETEWSLATSNIDNGPLVDRNGRITLTLRRADTTWRITSLSNVNLLAPPDGTIPRFMAALARDLNEKNTSGVMGSFDSRMKEYGELDNDIDALVTQNDVLCAIDIVSEHDKDGGAVALDLDWYVELKSRADAGPVRNRRERVQAELVKVGGKWKISHIDPISIVAP
jgi:ketosteroid isomerase-like protein